MGTTKEQFDTVLQDAVMQAERKLHMKQISDQVRYAARNGHSELQFLIDMPVEQAEEWLENAFVFYITKLNMVDSDTYPITDPLSIIATVRRVRKERNKKKKAEAAARKEGK